MKRRGWSSRGRAGLRTAATTLALTVGAATVPVAAQGSPLLPSTFLAPKKKGKGGLTPAAAAEKREPIQQQGKQMIDAGELTAATILYDNAAQTEGDPVLFLDSGETWLEIAKKDRDPAAAETAKQRAQVAEDILYFQLDSASDPDWRPVADEEVSGLLARAGQLMDDADETIAELEAEEEAVAAPESAPKRKRKPGNGRGLRIAGAAFMGLGVAGLGLGVAGIAIGGINQQRVDDPAVYGPEYDEYDAKGKRGNVLAGVGLAVGGAALVTGVVLFVIGQKRGKKAGAGQDSSASARKQSLALVPTGRGLAVTGRF